MPLSEHEQRMLDEMERNLYGRDSDVHVAPAGGIPRPHYRAIILGSVIALAGLGIIIAAVVTHIIVLGVVGFAAILTGVILAGRPGSPQEYPQATRQTQRPTRSSFSERMAQKWDERDQ